MLKLKIIVGFSSFVPEDEESVAVVVGLASSARLISVSCTKKIHNYGILFMTAPLSPHSKASSSLS
jgi:hypothetical protein